MSEIAIPGYTYGSPAVPSAPVTLAELHQLEAAVMFTDEDRRYLQLAGEVLRDQVEDILDLWYSFVASHPHL
ncbi:MAG: protogloblin ApPgb, partial [Chloroflexota bacterium]